MKIEGNIDIQAIIQKLRHGFSILSHMNWVSAPEFPLSVASIVGVVGFLLAIRDGKIGKFNSLPWSSDKDGCSEDFWVVPGLENIGNNCFLNVILQALSSCSTFGCFLEKIMEEFESSSVGNLPLTIALTSLVEELCTTRHGRAVLSPRRVMLAMAHYNPDFNLTSQQDAEEAFFHILSSLREELAECYVTNHGSLAEVATFPNCRILTPTRRVDQYEEQKWRRCFIGPFDGILGSILSCQSCSFQISLDFHLFHSLHLPPVLSIGGAIMDGCSVEDCLKQFLAAEKLENYFCSQCWHFAGIKYLSLLDESETDIKKLRSCSGQSSCDCKNLSRLGTLPWSNSFSRTFKQLSVARSPKILCIHLQRVSMNLFGELVKLQGHISFPLILNLSPFIKSGVGIKTWEEKFPRERSKQQFQQFHCSNHRNMQLGTRMLNCSNQQMGKMTFLEAVVAAEPRQTATEPLVSTSGQAFQGEPSLLDAGSCSDHTVCSMPMQSDEKVGGSYQLAPPELHTYRLVSVVQHFGRSGSGHYSVFRRARSKLNDEDPCGLPESALIRWFCISDSEVYIVSEEDVLAAEASVLFYEKIQ